MDPSYQMQVLFCPKCLEDFCEDQNVAIVYPHSNFNCSRCKTLISFDLLNRSSVNRETRVAARSHGRSRSETEAFQFEEMKKTLSVSFIKKPESETDRRQKVKNIKRKLEEIDEDRCCMPKNNEEVDWSQKRKREYHLGSISTFKSIELLMEKKVKPQHNESQMISDVLEKSGKLKDFQSFMDAPEVYFISSENTNARTTYFTMGDLMYINSFPQELSCMRYREIKMGVLRPYIQKTFIKFAYGCTSFLAEFEIFDSNCTRAQHFIKKCLGEERSFLKADIYNHNRVGSEGESFCIGIEGDNDSVESINKGCYMDSVKGGYITAAVNTKRINHFKIYLEDWPSKTCYTILGIVTKGLHYLKSAVKNKSGMKILECGVMADFSLEDLEEEL